MAHWGDSLVTYQLAAVELETADAAASSGTAAEHKPLHLQSRHPTLFWNCVWFFLSLDLPIFFLIDVSVTPKLPSSSPDGVDLDAEIKRVLPHLDLRGSNEVVHAAQQLVMKTNLYSTEN